MKGDGILAIWNDCVAGYEAEYESWYQGEHLIERLSVPGFLQGRRYESVNALPRFFTYYETASPEVLRSADYLELLENPSTVTVAIMTDVFLNTNRTVCRVLEHYGEFRGSFAVTVRGDSECFIGSSVPFPADLARQSGVARAEAWVASGEEGQTT